MSSCYLVAVFLVLALSICSQCHRLIQNNPTTVTIIDGLPESSDLRINCELGTPVGILQEGNRYRFNVDINEAHRVLNCRAIWRMLIGSWHAFQPKRDAGHQTVFWLVEEDGFFLSWDNSTWIRKSKWESE